MMSHSDLLSDLPGIVHGFAGKKLGDGRSDDVARNGLAYLHLDRYTLVRMKQIHGTCVVTVNGNTGKPVADGIMTVNNNGTEHKAVSVLTADCLPILFADPVRLSVAAVHAGWKGTLGGIAREMVHALCRSGSRPSDIRVAIGPHIGGCCYTVEPDRAALFMKEYRQKGLSNREGAWHLDLAEVTRHQLTEAGVAENHIDVCAICTSCDFKHYFSYRREPKATYGENISMIAVRV